MLLHEMHAHGMRKAPYLERQPSHCAVDHVCVADNHGYLGIAITPLGAFTSNAISKRTFDSSRVIALT